MKRILLLVVAAAALVVAGSASAHHPGSVSIVIRHQLHGCHAWAAEGGSYAASLRLHVARGTVLVVTDDDVMPHRLYQLAGPHAAITGAHMHHMDATARVALAEPGTYVFGTKAGEDYTKGVSTVGADNVLRLRVVVS